jgi:glutaredoxin
MMVREVAEELVAAGSGHVRLHVADLDAGDHPSGIGKDLSGRVGVPVLQLGEPGAALRIADMGVAGGIRVLGGRRYRSPARSAQPRHRERQPRPSRGAGRPGGRQVFVTPSCPYCPSAASLAFRLAMAAPQGQGVTVEAAEFPELSQRHQVSGVPRIVVNRAGAFVGALPEDRFVGEVLRLARTHPT